MKKVTSGTADLIIVHRHLCARFGMLPLEDQHLIQFGGSR